MLHEANSFFELEVQFLDRTSSCPQTYFPFQKPRIEFWMLCLVMLVSTRKRLAMTEVRRKSVQKNHQLFFSCVLCGAAFSFHVTNLGRPICLFD